MKTFVGKTHNIHHHSDLQGEIEIVIEDSTKVEKIGNSEEPAYVVKVNAQDIVDLVIEKLKGDKIGEIEQMNSREFIEKHL